ncbi:MAG: retropepsin-like aspartic protease [Pacificimonas sp.]
MSPISRTTSAVAAAAALALSLTACEELVTQAGSRLSQTADYDPTDVGSVDHALCLLGFSGFPMTKLVTGHHLVEVSLNGQPARFIVDTGANATVMHAPYAEDYGLGEARGLPAVAVGIGGGGQARQYGVDSLSLGDVTLRQGSILATDLSQLTEVLGPLSGGQITGLLGGDVLSEHRAVIDVARPLLFLIPGDGAPAPVDAAACKVDAAS